MRKAKYFTIGAIIFYIWYIYTGAVYHIPYYLTRGVLYKVLCIIALPVWIDMELAASLLFVLAPMVFFAVTVIIDLLPDFTKAQKIVLTVMPVISYALLWVMDFICSAHFSYSATH